MKHDRIITSKDLLEQKFFRNGETIGYTIKPKKSVEYAFHELLDNENRLTVGYDNVDVVCPSTENKYSICGFEEFMLVKHLLETLPEDEKLKFVNLGCGAGFMGNYISKKLNKMFFMSGNLFMAYMTQGYTV